jgi:hypothetical protein
MVWEFLGWVLAITFSVILLGTTSLILWGLFRELRRRK